MCAISAAAGGVLVRYSAFAAQSVPSPWTSADIGETGRAGSASYDNGTFTVNGSGNDIWAEADQFHYVYQPLDGSGQIIARVSTPTNTSEWAKAGVMIKESATSGSRYVLLATTPSHGTRLQYSTSRDTGVTSPTNPAWLKLVRHGSVFSAYVSTDGTSWQLAAEATVQMGTSVTAGLAVTAHDGSQLASATFDNVSVTPLQDATGSPVPAPWQSADIGNPDVAGASSYDNGVFTIRGGGNDIWADTDQFRYVYQSQPINGELTAHVTSQTRTSDWAKAGLMVKLTSAAHSSYALVAVTPDNGIAAQSNFTTNQSGIPYSFPNVWLKLVRTGNYVRASYSYDGTMYTGITDMTLNTPGTTTVLYGMFVTAHNGSALSQATFDNVTLRNIRVSGPAAN